MNAPILARLANAGRHAKQAMRALWPEDRAAVPSSAADFYSASFFTPAPNLSSRVRMTLEQATAGNLVAQWELFAIMEDTWPRLAKNLAELRRSAARATYSAQPYAKRGEKPTESAKDRAALVDQSLRQWWPRAGTLELSFEDTLFHALDAYGKGISALEIHWGQTDDGILPRCSHVLAPRRYGWNSDGNELGLVDLHGNSWQPFPQDHFLVGIWQARTGAPGATAVLRALAPYWAGVTFGWEWLLSNAQIFGVPFRWATFDKNKPELGPMLRDMLAAMGACGYGAFPDGTKLEFKEAAQNATGNPQVVVQELADKACDLLILGQELSGAAQAAGLGGGAAGLQSGVRADRLQTAAQWCADLLNYQLVPAILRANWGDTSEPPTIVVDVDDEPDPFKLAQRDQVLLNAGIELPRSWFYERHAIPLPVDGEEVITGRPAPSPFDGLALPQAAVPTRREPVAAKATAIDQATAALFKANAIEQLTEAQRKDYAPLIERVAALRAAADPAAFKAALAKLRADLPAIGGDFKRNPSSEVAAKWQEILAPAFVTGLAETNSKR